MFLKTNEVLNFNIDYIEVYASFKNIDQMLEGVDDDNSNTIQFGEFNLEKTTGLKNFGYKVSFKYNNLSVFSYYTGKKLNGKIITRDYFTVYGAAFSQFNTSEIINFIKTYLTPDSINIEAGIKSLTLKRFDLALDINRNLKSGVLKYFKDRENIGANFYGAKGELQTHYIGAYTIRENKTKLIRIYNKIEDIKKKGMQQLYPNYLLLDNVTRVEIEFRSELTKHVKLDTLLNDTYLYNLFIKYLKKYTSIFESLKTNEVSKLKRLNKKISVNDLRYDQIAKQNYVSTFLGYSKKLLEIGACPIDILLRNNIISDLTLKDITYCTRIIKKNHGRIEYSRISENSILDLGIYSNGATHRNAQQRASGLTKMSRGL